MRAPLATDDDPPMKSLDSHNNKAAARIASQEHERHAHCAPSIMFAERHPCTHEVRYDANTSLAIAADASILDSAESE